MSTFMTRMRLPLSTRARAQAMALKHTEGNLTAYTVQALEAAIKRDERREKKCS